MIAAETYKLMGVPLGHARLSATSVYAAAPRRTNFRVLYQKGELKYGRTVANIIKDFH
jgi:hypothetical protein